jgi:site-specific DNA recombinase
VDFLTKKKVKNNGEAPQYCLEDSHPAIIDKEMWEAAQH